MTENRLRLNGDKTDIIVFGTRTSLKAINACNVHICNSPIEISNAVRNLGFLLDPHLTMEKQINKICQISMFHLKNISRIRYFIDEDTAKLLINAFVTSRLDYCNSLLSGMSKNIYVNFKRYKIMQPEQLLLKTNMITFPMCLKTSIGCQSERELTLKSFT
jgi:hypothetical protein